MTKKAHLVVLLGILFAALPLSAMAKPSFLSAFEDRYPNSTLNTLPGDRPGCAICHPGGDEGNGFTSYGSDFKSADGGNSERFQAIESSDSDGDSFSNLTEINANTNPSDSNSHPIIPAILKVVSPKGGEGSRTTTGHTLRWTSTGAVGANVKITLWKGGVLSRTLFSTTPNDGTQTWTIPAAVVPGANYKIRVASVSKPTILANSNASLAITQFQMTAPVAANRWALGTTHVIRWVSSANSGASVRLSLYKGKTFNSAITLSTPNNGQFSWKVPSTLAVGADYRIVLTSTTNSANSALSPIFSITATP